MLNWKLPASKSQEQEQTRSPINSALRRVRSRSRSSRVIELLRNEGLTLLKGLTASQTGVLSSDPVSPKSRQSQDGVCARPRIYLEGIILRPGITM